MKTCSKCVLPENGPDIVIDNGTICNICNNHAENVNKSKLYLETDFTKIISKYKGKNKYDCLVMCSGGKDSTLSLYYMKKKYGLKPLAFTFDHGFENHEALENVKNATNILNVDFYYFKTNYMKDVFAKIIKTKSKAPICHLCAIWYVGVVHDFAKKNNIPLIIGGWTKGQVQDETTIGQEFISMSEETKKFVQTVLHTDPKYKNFPVSMSDLLKKKNKKFKCRFLSPYWFFKWDMENAMKILTKELNWKLPTNSYPKNSTNCLMNYLYVIQTIKNYGYTHYHVEMSRQIRSGELTRREALEMLKIDFDNELIKGVLKELGCDKDDI